MTSTFTGADAVYAIIPLSYTEPSADLVKAENVEHLFDGMDASLTIMRLATFYTNFYQTMDLFKGKGFIGKLLTLSYSGLWALLTMAVMTVSFSYHRKILQMLSQKNCFRCPGSKPSDT